MSYVIKAALGELLGTQKPQVQKMDGVLCI